MNDQSKTFTTASSEDSTNAISSPALVDGAMPFGYNRHHGARNPQVTPDADRADAGAMTYRRFTELWALRAGEWKKVVRHANHFDPEGNAAQ